MSDEESIVKPLVLQNELAEPPPLRAFAQSLEYQRPPLCPELGLWLLGDQVDLESTCLGLGQLHAPPFWAFCWGSGQAMARFLLDQPEWVRGRRVVDFGTGSGVAAIAAGLAGADSVMGVDSDPEARVAAARNAASNEVELVTSGALPEEWDVLLACDVLYQPSQWARLQSLAQGGRPVLVSDPERPSSPRFEIAPQARYAVRTLPDVDSPAKSAAVFQLSNRGFGPG
ncbi:MAG TPA: methyltransferase [Myxococcales bacterium]|nr:methyltransferase [Myxococcales bacterium]